VSMYCECNARHLRDCSSSVARLRSQWLRRGRHCARHKGMFSRHGVGGRLRAVVEGVERELAHGRVLVALLWHTEGHHQASGVYGQSTIITTALETSAFFFVLRTHLGSCMLHFAIVSLSALGCATNAVLLLLCRPAHSFVRPSRTIHSPTVLPSILGGHCSFTYAAHRLAHHFVNYIAKHSASCPLPYFGSVCCTTCKYKEDCHTST
jgi:hypothetical protein